MEDELEEIVAQQKDVIIGATDRLIDLYFRYVKHNCRSLDVRHRLKIVEKLEDLVVLMFGDSGALQQSHFILYTSFDPAIARKVREDAGLTLRQMAGELGFKNEGSIKTSISLYETGRNTIPNPPQGEISRKYLEWLKEKGYNPYRL